MVITDLAFSDDDDDDRLVPFGIVPKLPESFLSGIAGMMSPFADALRDVITPNLTNALLPIASVMPDITVDLMPKSFVSTITEMMNPSAGMSVNDLLGPNLAEALLPIASMLPDITAANLPKGFLTEIAESTNLFANIPTGDLVGPAMAEAMLPIASMMSDVAATAMPKSFLSDFAKVLAGIQFPADFTVQDFIKDADLAETLAGIQFPADFKVQDIIKDVDLADPTQQSDESLTALDPIRVVVVLVVVAFAVATYLARRQLAAGAEVIAPYELAANVNFLMTNYFELTSASWIPNTIDKVVWMGIGHVVSSAVAGRKRPLESAGNTQTSR